MTRPEKCQGSIGQNKCVPGYYIEKHYVFAIGFKRFRCRENCRMIEKEQ